MNFEQIILVMAWSWSWCIMLLQSSESIELWPMARCDTWQMEGNAYTHFTSGLGRMVLKWRVCNFILYFAQALRHLALAASARLDPISLDQVRVIPCRDISNDLLWSIFHSQHWACNGVQAPYSATSALQDRTRQDQVRWMEIDRVNGYILGWINTWVQFLRTWGFFLGLSWEVVTAVLMMLHVPLSFCVGLISW